MLTTAHEKINDNKTVRKIGIKLLKKYSLNGKLNLIRINTILKNNAIKLVTAITIGTVIVVFSTNNHNHIAKNPPK